MPAVASSPSPASFATNETVSLAPAPLTFAALVTDNVTQPASEVASAARHAVDSAMAIADHFTTGGQRAVSLQFSVSGVDLAVRVELRGDSVHTTFRTDSPELRTALAHEWQSVVAAQPGEGAQRLADPVFAAASKSDSLMQADSGGAQQREPGAREPRSFAEEFPGWRTAPRSNAAGGEAPAAVPLPSRLAPAALAGRLHAFA